MLDNALVASCDEEAVEFLIQYKLRKLWNQVLNDVIHVEKLKEGLIKVRDWFENKEEGRGQYRATISLILGLPEETKETFLTESLFGLSKFKLIILKNNYMIMI